jgi:hypothetical protein
MLPSIDYDRGAGWSSLVARWAHNPKVGGSNPPPATKIKPSQTRINSGFFFWLPKMSSGLC